MPQHAGYDLEFFFLPGQYGPLFATWTCPAGQTTCENVILYIHPFGEEMNKSRRTVALQAKAMAIKGFATLTVDLPGCGDSYGDLGSVSWEQWIDEMQGCISWLKRKTDSPIRLWGLRMGALLVAEIAANCKKDIENILLWQPVVEGKSIVSGFLRLALAGSLLKTNGRQRSVEKLRNQLASGSGVEIGGYELSSRLSHSLEEQSLTSYSTTDHAVDWIEVGKREGKDISIASSRVIDRWIEHGTNVRSYVAVGESFWNTVEISECTGLIDLTSSVLKASAR